MHKQVEQGVSGSIARRNNNQQGGSEANEIKRLKEELRKAQSVNALMTGAVHDIKNLIAPVYSGSSLILDGSSISTSERIKTMKLIHASAESLLEVTDDLLEFSQMSGEREPEIDNKTFNLHCAIEKIMQISIPRAEEKGLLCECEIASDVPEIVKGDRKRLKRVLLNLIGNAIKFTEKGSVKLLIEKMVGKPNGIFFRVEDTGIGIPKGDRKLLFQPFVQAGDHIQKQFGGSGLGLSICKQIVDKMGGQIGIDTIDKRSGTTIWFHCKLENSNSSIPPMPIPSQLPESVTRQKSILVVDDNVTNRSVAEGMIKKLGYNVSSVGSAQEALKELEVLKYDLVLMDCRMPVMNGYEATRQIRSLGITVPIIAYTAAGNERDALNSGMDAQLTKPVSSNKLAVTLEHFLFDN